MRIIFMGTPDFAAVALQGFIDSKHDVVAVYSQPPRPKGRGKHVQESPVHALATKYNIPVHTPLSFKKDVDALDIFKSYDADIAVVAAYGLILPQNVLDAPKYGCINIHGSILPRWRGASPIHHAILHGDQNSGITIMQMEKGLDSGPILSIHETPIHDNMTTVELHDILAEIGRDAALETLDKMPLEGQIQDENLVTYASQLTRDDGRINWHKTAKEIERQWRAFTPWPGIWTMDQDGKRFKIHGVEIVQMSSGTPVGLVMDKHGHVMCGDNTCLKITQIQPDNAKVMDFAAAVNGNYIMPDATRFS